MKCNNVNVLIEKCFVFYYINKITSIMIIIGMGQIAMNDQIFGNLISDDLLYIIYDLYYINQGYRFEYVGIPCVFGGDLI